MYLEMSEKKPLTIEDNFVFRKKEDVIERHGEELLLFDSSEGKLFELNETGKMIWTMLDAKHPVKEIKEKMNEEFEETGTIDIDLSIFFKRLLELDLIEKIQ